MKTPPPLFSASTVMDSILFRDAFGTQAMRGLFSDQALVQRYIDAEVALARAEARCGVIPAEAAEVIARESRLDRIDFDHMREETDIVGYPILPLVHQLVAMCGEAGRYVHWGATTQDIMDTAVALQVRDALDSIDAEIRALRSILADLATKHRGTPMAGRTHLQQALPITFGYKAAIWLAMFDRHQQRLAQLRPRVALVEFAGAAGTLASLGDRGLEVQKAMAEELGLGVPATTWHVARDGFAEAVNLLALVTGSLGKIRRGLTPGQVGPGRPGGRCRPHAPQPRHQPRPDRGRGRDDGAGAAHGAPAGARCGLRRLPQRQRTGRQPGRSAGRFACRYAAPGPQRH